MISVNFNPAPDGLSRPIAKLVNSHLANPFYYAQWVDESPTRNKLDPISWFQTHPHPKIWTNDRVFALGIATLFDPKFSLRGDYALELQNKPSTAYLIFLSHKNTSIISVVIENTPSGKCVLYYRTEQVLAIREVSFEIFKRDLTDLCKKDVPRMGYDLAYQKYFGSSPPPLELTCCTIPLSYPNLSPSHSWQPYNFKRECMLWFKVAIIIFQLVAFAFLIKCKLRFPVKQSPNLPTKIIDLSLPLHLCAACTLTITVSLAILTIYRRPYRGPYLQQK